MNNEYKAQLHYQKGKQGIPSNAMRDTGQKKGKEEGPDEDKHEFPGDFPLHAEKEKRKGGVAEILHPLFGKKGGQVPGGKRKRERKTPLISIKREEESKRKKEKRGIALHPRSYCACGRRRLYQMNM